MNDDNPVFISDNVEAMKICAERGILHLLKPKDTANSAFHCFETEKHWCMASHHIGHAEDKDNGYAVILVPKTRMNKEEAAHLFTDCILHTSESVSYGYERIAPLKNN